MSPARPVPEVRPSGYSAAQMRVITAAIGLFAENGVGGTSLQMIADVIGVTKAAVYHQFKSKEEIVIATASTELVNVEAAIEDAEARPTPAEAREVLIDHMVDLAVKRRRMESILVGDPVIVRYFAKHEPYRLVMDRLYRILMGENAGTGDRVPAAMLTAAIGGAVMHPLVADLDDDTIRSQLLHLARRFLDLPD